MLHFYYKPYNPTHLLFPPQLTICPYYIHLFYFVFLQIPKLFMFFMCNYLIYFIIHHAVCLDLVNTPDLNQEVSSFFPLPPTPPTHPSYLGRVYVNSIFLSNYFMCFNLSDVVQLDMKFVI